MEAVPGTRASTRRPWRWVVVAVALGLLQWVVFLVDLSASDLVVFSYLNVPVVLSVGFGRPRMTGLLAGQAVLLGSVSATVNGYLDTASGWVRLGLMLVVCGVSWALSFAFRRVLRGRDEALIRLAEAEERFRLLATETSDVVFQVSDRGVIEWASPSVEHTMGWHPADLVGRASTDLVSPHDHDRLLAELMPQIRAGGGTSSIFRALQGDGSFRWMDAQGDALPPPLGGRVIRLRDVDEHMAAVQTLESQAGTDPLTGLPNRRAARTWFDVHGPDRRSGTGRAVLFVDLDRLKAVNDDRGHEVGDALLRAIATRLSSCVRSTDLAARMGGDEFVVALPGVDSRQAAFDVATSVLRSCSEPVELPDGTEVSPTVSVGVAWGLGDENWKDLIGQADGAMYAAKSRGRGRVVLDGG